LSCILDIYMRENLQVLSSFGAGEDLNPQCREDVTSKIPFLSM
jgi:hypothetical protein